MLKELVREFKQWKWGLRDLIGASIILICIFIYGAAAWPLVFTVALFYSAFFGLLFGRFLGRLISNWFLERHSEFEQRLRAGLSAFGFVLMPALVGYCISSYLDIDLFTQSFAEVFLWACAGGAIFFCVKPSDAAPR